MKFRYKLKGTARWCLNYKSGWLSIGRWIVRWNTQYIFDPKENYTLFSIGQVKKHNA
jgi:hypothetical protein